MNISCCKTNHITNPLGFSFDQITVSWITESTVSEMQEKACITVSLSEDMKDTLYTTGKADLDSRGTVLPLQLEPCTRYYWTVQVWGNGKDTSCSAVNWFETGKRSEPWKGKWITPSWKDKNIHPCMRKSFTADSAVKSARIYATGMGSYILELNGKRVGNEYLAPGCTAYDAWVQVQTYDVTGMIQSGENVFGALLGNGWAKGKFGTFPNENSPYTDTFALLAELHITCRDGTETVISTDDSWKCAPSPVIATSIYDGEIYDARKEQKGWPEPGFDDRKWTRVCKYAEKTLGKLEDRRSLPVIVKDTIKPLKLIKTPAGETVLDLGQNIAGWLRFRIHEKNGNTVKISYGEVLQNDNFYRDNLRKAKAEFTYTSSGCEQTVEPHFTYYGFRYAKLEGFTQPVRIEDFTGCSVYSDLDDTGTLETSDPAVNRLFCNAQWSQKDNFLDVPTDCPQRDERMGWTGDAQVFCRTASFNMDTYAFYAKFTHDLYKEQQMMHGMVGSVVPSFMKDKPTTSDFVHGGSSVWGDAAVIIPWTVYLQYGDTAILTQQYASMKAWVEWNIRQDKAACNTHLRTTGFHFGDWLALDGPVPGGVEGGTETAYIASAYYKYACDILSKTARILGKEKDAVKYGNLSHLIVKAIQREYFSASWRAVLHNQTVYVLALSLDLVPESAKPVIASQLAKRMLKDNTHLKTGFTGTPFLCPALSANGYSGLAYNLFFQEDYPSWLYEVKMGATTIWERWNSILPDGKISGTDMNSLNHYSYGSIAEWMYRYMAGITPLESFPGYKKFELRPQFDHRLISVKAVYRSAMGTISSAWQRNSDGSILYQCTVPFNTAAVLSLPGGKQNIQLKPGVHEFTYIPAENVCNNYSLKNTITELETVPEIKQLLEKTLPDLKKMPSMMAPQHDASLEDYFAKTDPLFIGKVLKGVNLGSLDKKLQQIQPSVRDNGFRLK